MNLLKDKLESMLKSINYLENMSVNELFSSCVEKRLEDSLNSYKDDLRYENKSLLYKCKNVKSLIRLLEISE